MGVGGREKEVEREGVRGGGRCLYSCFLECCFGSSIQRGRLFQRMDCLDSLGGGGEEDGEEVDGVVDLVVVILMILLLRTRERDTELSRKVGDLDSGPAQLLVRPGATWLEIEETDNKKHRGAIHGLEGTVVVDSTVPHHLHEAAQVRAHPQDIRVQDLGQRQEDRSYEIFMA